MIPQIKFFIVFLLLIFLVLMPSNAQEEQLTSGKYPPDSLTEVYTQQLNRQLNLLEKRLLRAMALQQETIDSLAGVFILLDAEIRDLEKENRELNAHLEQTEQIAILNKHLFNAEKEKIRRIFYITGPSLLGLIMIATVLFFLLISRQSEQTDRKIMALRKYTHNEVDETRNELLNSFKKRIKKLREKMKREKNERGNQKAVKRKKGKKK